jgi:thiol:disulfide interchange protein DsbD
MLSFGSVQAQLSPITWDFDLQKIDAENAYVVMTATVQKGWKLYGSFPFSNDETDKIQTITIKNNKKQCDSNLGPVCLEISVENTEIALGEVTANKEPKAEYSKIFDGNIVYYDGNVQFRQKIKITPNQKIKGSVYFMTCDGERCLPPTTTEFEFEY